MSDTMTKKLSDGEVDDLAVDIANEALHHIDTMYPNAWGLSPKTFRTSLRNTIIAAVNTRFRGSHEPGGSPIRIPPRKFDIETHTGLYTEPDTLVRWMSPDTWRCHCKPPGDINASNAGVCTDCGTLRPEKKSGGSHGGD